MATKTKSAPTTAGPTIDKGWFLDRISEAGLSQRKLAIMMGIAPSLMSKRLSGGIVIPMAEAAFIAKVLKQPFEEVARRAGISVEQGQQAVAPVVGHAAGFGAVSHSLKGLPKGVELPGPGLGALSAIVLKDAAAMEQWALLYAPAKRVEAEAAGRLSVVVAGGRTYLGVLTRGADRGLWNLSDLSGRALVSDLVLESAAPVQWIKA